MLQKVSHLLSCWANLPAFLTRRHTLLGFRAISGVASMHVAPTSALAKGRASRNLSTRGCAHASAKGIVAVRFQHIHSHANIYVYIYNMYIDMYVLLTYLMQYIVIHDLMCKKSIMCASLWRLKRSSACSTWPSGNGRRLHARMAQVEIKGNRSGALRLLLSTGLSPNHPC